MRGMVILTVVATSIVGGLAAAYIWWMNRRRAPDRLDAGPSSDGLDRRVMRPSAARHRDAP